MALSVAAVAAVAAEPGGPMLMQDAVPAVFVPGVKAAPGVELDAWVMTRPGVELKLPVTIWRGTIGEIEHAEIGVVTDRTGEKLDLQDRLGVALTDRLRTDCGDAARCVVWLSGRFGGLVGDPPAAVGAFSVLGYHGQVAADASPMASAARPTECLAIRLMQPIHCARGPKRCSGCREAMEVPAESRLLDLCPDNVEVAARPVIDIVRNGVTEHRVFDVVRVFADEAEGRAFAERHGITDVGP